MKRDSLPATEHQLDVQPISRDVLAEKYFKPGETSLDQLYGRVARSSGFSTLASARATRP